MRREKSSQGNAWFEMVKTRKGTDCFHNSFFLVESCLSTRFTNSLLYSSVIPLFLFHVFCSNFSSDATGSHCLTAFHLKPPSSDIFQIKAQIKRYNFHFPNQDTGLSTFKDLILRSREHLVGTFFLSSWNFFLK